MVMWIDADPVPIWDLLGQDGGVVLACAELHSTGTALGLALNPRWVKIATDVGMPWAELNPDAVRWNLEPFPALFGDRVTPTLSAATAVPTNANKASEARRRDFLVN